jgi:NADH:ubiquinone oxidoreductase subunit F (NADH-binding)
MTLAIENPSRQNPRAATRLLRGLAGDDLDPRLATHLERWGALVDRGSTLIRELEESGLAGHGGAWFPVGAKWKAVADSGQRRPVVVANGAESEPASHKDAFLMSRAPHLVLDGLVAAATTLDANRAIVHVAPPSRGAIERAVEERHRRHLDPCTIEIVDAPDRFLAGQESALVNRLNGEQAALPSFVGLRSIRERGVSGRPTLVQNTETLAQVALIARFGSQWFRETGTAENPGTMLLTLTVPGGPYVVEAALGSSLSASLGLGDRELSGTQGVLLGGYGGGWVATREFAELPVLEKAARRLGATLGAGVVAPLPVEVCPLAEMADVVRYMEAQGAGQCGPCVHGLADLADALESITYGKGAGRWGDRILETANLIDGRGACRHPDGVVRFVRSGLRVFADEVASHQRRGPCTRTGAPRVLPIPNRLTKRKLVTRS